MIDLIIEGLRVACKKTIEYAREESINIPAEYLLTTSVADVIFNKFQTDYYKVLLEFNTKSLSDMNYENFGGELFDMCMNDVDNTHRNGNVDIAVIDGNDKPLTCIELKRFNPTKSILYKDVKRLSELVNRKSSTGKPFISENYLTFVYGKKGNFADNSKISEEAKKIYSEILNSLNKEFLAKSDTKHFPFSFDVYTKQVSYKNLINHDPDTGQDISHLYLGVVLIIRNQNISLTN